MPPRLGSQWYCPNLPARPCSCRPRPQEPPGLQQRPGRPKRRPRRPKRPGLPAISARCWSAFATAAARCWASSAAFAAQRSRSFGPPNPRPGHLRAVAPCCGCCCGCTCSSSPSSASCCCCAAGAPPRSLRPWLDRVLPCGAPSSLRAGFRKKPMLGKIMMTAVPKAGGRRLPLACLNMGSDMPHDCSCMSTSGCISSRRSATASAASGKAMCRLALRFHVHQRKQQSTRGSTVSSTYPCCPLAGPAWRG